MLNLLDLESQEIVSNPTTQVLGIELWSSTGQQGLFTSEPSL